jgi:hypothetical protein
LPHASHLNGDGFSALIICLQVAGIWNDSKKPHITMLVSEGQRTVPDSDVGFPIGSKVFNKHPALMMSAPLLLQRILVPPLNLWQN